jgi:hypothetical protein
MYRWVMNPEKDMDDFYTIIIITASLDLFKK